MERTVAPLDGQAGITPQIHRLLREEVVRLRFPPGTLLSEAEVARRFGVSRQPVREAFIKLQEEGLLSIRPQRGTIVQRISVATVFDARFVREVVEVAVVREAAMMRPDGLDAELAGLMAAQERAAEQADTVEFLRLDEAFHRALADGIDRSLAWTTLEAIKAQMDRVRFLSIEGETPLPVLIRQHRAIAAAIAAGNPDAAEAALRAHLREILASLPRIAEAYPEFFELPTKGRPTLRKEDAP